MGSAGQGGGGLTERGAGLKSEVLAGTAQMADPVHFMVLQRVGPWRHKAIRHATTGKAWGQLSCASSPAASTLLAIATAL